MAEWKSVEKKKHRKMMTADEAWEQEKLLKVYGLSQTLRSGKAAELSTKGYKFYDVLRGGYDDAKIADIIANYAKTNVMAEIESLPVINNRWNDIAIFVRMHALPSSQ